NFMASPAATSRNLPAGAGTNTVGGPAGTAASVLVHQLQIIWALAVLSAPGPQRKPRCAIRWRLPPTKAAFGIRSSMRTVSPSWSRTPRCRPGQAESNSTSLSLRTTWLIGQTARSIPGVGPAQAIAWETSPAGGGGVCHQANGDCRTGCPATVEPAGRMARAGPVPAEG